MGAASAGTTAAGALLATCAGASCAASGCVAMTTSTAALTRANEERWGVCMDDASRGEGTGVGADGRRRVDGHHFVPLPPPTARFARGLSSCPVPDADHHANAYGIALVALFLFTLLQSALQEHFTTEDTEGHRELPAQGSSLWPSVSSVVQALAEPSGCKSMMWLGEKQNRAMKGMRGIEASTLSPVGFLASRSFLSSPFPA